MKDVKKKVKPQPMTLEVSFPVTASYADKEISQAKFNRILRKLSSISDNEFKFIFDSAADCVRIVPT